MKPKMHPNYFHLMHHCMLFKIKKRIFAPPLKQLRFWQTSQSLLILNSLCSTCHAETSFHNHHKVFWLKSSSLFYHLKIGFILTTADGAYFRVVSGFAPSGWDRVALTWCHLGQGQRGERERERKNERKKEGCPSSARQPDGLVTTAALSPPGGALILERVCLCACVQCPSVIHVVPLFLHLCIKIICYVCINGWTTRMVCWIKASANVFRASWWTVTYPMGPMLHYHEESQKKKKKHFPIKVKINNMGPV